MRISDWSSDVLFRLDFNAVEGDVARETRVDEAAGVRGQPPRILWHREQGDAAVGPGRDDAHVGDMAVEDEAFPAVETKAVAGAGRGGRDAGGAVLGAFVAGGCADCFPPTNGGGIGRAAGGGRGGW